MPNELVKKLKAVKSLEGRVNPDRVWVAKNKELMMNQIGNTVSEYKPTFSLDTMWQAVQILLPGRVAYTVVRPLAVFLLIGAIATSGWITTASATQNSLPGDITYGVKVAMSNLTKDNIAVAKDISQDVKKVAETAPKDKAKKVAVGVEYLKKSLDSAKKDIQESVEEDSDKIVEKAKQVNDSVREINKNLKETTAKINDPANAQTSEVEEVEKIVNEAKQVASDSAQAVVEQVVQKKVDGKLTVSDEAVKQIVSDHIDTILADTTEIKKQVDVTVGAIVSSTVPVVATDTTSTATSTGVNTSTTVSLVSSSTETTSVASTTQAVKDAETLKTIIVEQAKKVIETEAVAKENLAQAKQLVEDNHLIEAIQKVKEVVVAKQEAEKTATEVKKVVNEMTASQQTVPMTNVVSTTPITPTVATGTVENKVQSQ